MKQINSAYISTHNWAKSFLEFDEWSLSPELSDVSVKTKLLLKSVEGRLTLDMSAKICANFHFSNTSYTQYEKAACHMA